MKITDELERLGDLHRRGALTDDEFAAAKAAVLSGGGEHPLPEHYEAMQRQLSDIQRQNDVLRLDHDWHAEREQFMMSGAHGRRYIPTHGTNLFTSV